MDKETALNMVNSRIRGVNGTIDVNAANLAEYKAKRNGYEPKPVNLKALRAELTRLEAAKADIEKRKK